ncbi:hypothetical protein Pden_3142 [Paracoccus denitrificans PD1222]|uniref:Uncharacterized protein n=1 Tax=Paracoccus denitrificans (strain Pd 1222) TaxID=318586 RepID=A1B6S9_PARDP|nr:hypothetical protein Pden_3142 [Paracoccus denitrificans PD1222]
MDLSLAECSNPARSVQKQTEAERRQDAERSNVAPPVCAFAPDKAKHSCIAFVRCLNQWSQTWLFSTWPDKNSRNRSKTD